MKSIIWRRVRHPGVGPVEGTLFEAHARATDPDTSHAAADAVDANWLEYAVLQGFDRVPDDEATVKELAVVTGIPLWSLSPRMRPLVRKGYVVDTGKRR